MSPDGEMGLGSVGQVLDALNTIIIELDMMGKEIHPPEDGFGMHLPWLVGAEMHSPLRINIALSLVPKDAVKAIVELIKSALFYKQETSMKAAQAALEWEAVRMKRLHNLSEAIRIARNLSQDLPPDEIPHIPDYRIKNLLDAVETLETSVLRPTGVRLEENP